MKKSRLAKFTPLPTTLLLALATGCSSPETESEPAPPTNQWNGQTYLLDVTEVQWSEPRGIGKEIDLFVPNFLMRIEGESPDSFDVFMATAKADGTQDMCNLTRTLTANGSAPGAVIGPDEFPLHIEHADEEIEMTVDGLVYDFTFTDTLPNGNTMSTSGELTATMDFRDLYELFTLLIDPTPESVCVALEESYGKPCAPCPNDGQPYCLTIKAIELGAVPSSTEIEPVSELDPSCTIPPE